MRRADSLAGSLVARALAQESGVFSASLFSQARGGQATRSFSAIPSRSLRGLYGGKQVQFGNKVSEDGGNKTRRKWKPNVVTKNLYSDLLERKFRLKVTTYVLRCINKHGSLDNYLLRTKENKIKSQIGLELKKRVELALKAREELSASPVGEDAKE